MKTPRPTDGFRHLAIDVQRSYISALTPQRRVDFPSGVSDFARDLRSVGIPTLWVAMDWTRAIMIPPRKDNPDWARDRELLGLTEVTLHEEDLVATKNSFNALTNAQLREHLDEQNVHTLILTGMDTTQCVAKTLLSALACRFRCIVATDRLADGNGHLSRAGDEASPETHLKALQAELRNWADRPVYGLANNIVAQINKDPDSFFAARPSAPRRAAPRSAPIRT